MMRELMPDDYRKPGVELEPSPRDTVRTSMWNALLERAAGIRHQPTPLDVGEFKSVRHRLTPEQIRTAIAKRQAKRKG